MSINEILEELPKLTESEKRQLWNVLDHELTPEEDEESPEVLKLIHQNYLIYYQVNEGNKTVEVRVGMQFGDTRLPRRQPWVGRLIIRVNAVPTRPFAAQYRLSSDLIYDKIKHR